MGRESAGMPAGFDASQPRPRHGRPSSLRILHVGHAADGNVLGVIGGLAADQIPRGWDVHVAWPASAAGAWALHTEVGATVHQWDAPRDRPTAAVIARNSLVRIVRAVAPDVVHLHTPYAGLIGRLALRGKVPTLYEPYWWPFETRRSRAVLAWERTARGWTDLTLCNSEHSHQMGEALECLARRSRVSAPGVDLAAWAPSDRAAARRRLGINPYLPVAVQPGSFVVSRGQDIAISAWPLVRHRMKTAELYLIGDGPTRPALEREGADGVTFVGAGEEKAWMAAADVVIFPSRAPGVQLEVLEAMASGRSVVCSDVGSVYEWIGGGGRVIQPGEPVLLAHALSARLAEPDLAQREGAANRKRAIDMFDLRVRREDVAGITAALVNGRRHHRGHV